MFACPFPHFPYISFFSYYPYINYHVYPIILYTTILPSILLDKIGASLIYLGKWPNGYESNGHHK